MSSRRVKNKKSALIKRVADKHGVVDVIKALLHYCDDNDLDFARLEDVARDQYVRDLYR